MVNFNHLFFYTLGALKICSKQFSLSHLSYFILLYSKCLMQWNEMLHNEPAGMLADKSRHGPSPMVLKV